MPTSFESLPANLLDAILSFDDMSRCLLLLWMSGSRLLRYKIAIGATRIDLREPRRRSQNRCPKAIEEMQGLRELTINNYDRVMPYYRSIENLRSLSSGLRKLTLRIANSKRLLSPPEVLLVPEDSLHVNGGNLNKPSWTFAAAFPQLETLVLHSDESWPSSDFALLPSSLTKLTLSWLPQDADGEYSFSLPRQLLSLEVCNGRTISPSFWTRLPPHLTEINVSCHQKQGSKADISHIGLELPRSLTKLGRFLQGDFAPTSLPPGLVSLDATWLIDLNCWSNADFERFGAHYAQLKLFSGTSITPRLARALPSTVHTISVHRAVKTPDDKYEWPSSLTDLALSNLSPNDFDASILPSGLTTISLDEEFILDLELISLFPHTLLNLAAAGGTLGDVEKVSFPPRLTTLSLSSRSQTPHWLLLYEKDGSSPTAERSFGYSDYDVDPTCYNGRLVYKCFPYHKLPQSITELSLGIIIPASRLKDLPRRLLSLNIDDIFEDAEYHPDDAIEMDAMRSTFEAGSAEGIKESFDWKRLERTSIATLLPRTLKEFLMWGDACLEHVDYGMLPPLMTGLMLHSDHGLPGHYLPRMPLQHLQSLHVTLREVSSDQLASINPHIRSGALNFKGPCDLPLATLLPYSRFINQRSLPNEHPMTILCKLRQDHAIDEDLSYLQRLYSPDAEIIEMLHKTSAELQASEKK